MATTHGFSADSKHSKISLKVVEGYVYSNPISELGFPVILFSLFPH